MLLNGNRPKILLKVPEKNEKKILEMPLATYAVYLKSVQENKTKSVKLLWKAELSKLKREAEEATIHREAAISSIRKKHNEALAEMEQQIEASNFARQK